VSKPLRQSMPTVAAFIDDMRETFGADAVNGQIKKGMQGLPVFWASENGTEIGARPPRGRVEVSVADMCLTPPEKTKGAYR